MFRIPFTEIYSFVCIFESFQNSRKNQIKAVICFTNSIKYKRTSTFNDDKSIVDVWILSVSLAVCCNNEPRTHCPYWLPTNTCTKKLDQETRQDAHQEDTWAFRLRLTKWQVQGRGNDLELRWSACGRREIKNKEPYSGAKLNK